MVGKILSTRMLELEKATQHQGIIDVSIYFLTSGTDFQARSLSLSLSLSLSHILASPVHHTFYLFNFMQQNLVKSENSLTQ